MLYLYQKDNRAQPGNLQNQRYSFLPPTHSNVVSLTTAPPLSLSLSLSPYYERLLEMRIQETEHDRRIKKDKEGETRG
jgi:hypothetical protein